MTGDLASLLAAGVPRPLFYAWSVLVMAICVVGHLRIQRRYRRLVRKTEADLRRLGQRIDEYAKKIDEYDADIMQIRAELDAYGAWSEANDRFFHHGLVAVSHLLGARALPARRACIGERRSTIVQQATATAWRPKPIRAANPASGPASTMQVQRRTCT
ncbi:hypothetical protein [Candidatus Poriferisodalis sp.]|uniref:hypothetical protein n=1 Tax=Candidatus Poriferisodalis sp. TaxID=3101277 RepID=UPI003B01F8AB